MEVAKRQLARVKEEKLCQVERIFVVQKIAKLEDDLQVCQLDKTSSSMPKGSISLTISGNPKTKIGKQEAIVGKQSVVKSRVKVGFTIEIVLLQLFYHMRYSIFTQRNKGYLIFDLCQNPDESIVLLL